MQNVKKRTCMRPYCKNFYSSIKYRISGIDFLNKPEVFQLKNKLILQHMQN